MGHQNLLGMNSFNGRFSLGYSYKGSSQKLMRFLPFYAQYGAPNGLGGLNIHDFRSLGNGECKGGQEWSCLSGCNMFEWFYSFNTLKQPSKWWKYVKICSYADSGPWWWGARSFDGLGTVTNGFSTKNGARWAVLITDFYDLVFSGPL